MNEGAQSAEFNAVLFGRAMRYRLQAGMGAIHGEGRKISLLPANRGSIAWKAEATYRKVKTSFYEDLQRNNDWHASPG